MKPKKQSAWGNLKEHARYRLDQIFSGGSLPQVIFLFGFTTLVVLLGATASLFGLFGDENKGIDGIGRKHGGGALDTLWWSAKHVFDPSFFDMDYGATWPVVLISLIITVLGMLLFATLVGFVSSGIEGRVDQMKKGNSAVKERGHVLILGWSDKVFSILSLLEDRAEDVKVVVLSHHSIEHMAEELRVHASELEHVQIILRTGAPTSRSELDRVAFTAASSIIVLGDESGPGSSDVGVLKTLMLLAASPVTARMVAEIADQQHLKAARAAAAGKVAILCSSRIISKVTVQTARQVGFSRVYSELFGFAGNEIYIREFKGAAGRKFGSLRPCFTNAVPIGVSRKDGAKYVPVINPGDGYEVKADEWIICVAKDDDIAFDASAAAPVTSIAAGSTAPAPVAERIAIFGWNDQIYEVLSQLDGHLTAATEIVVAALLTNEQADSLLRENLPRPLTHAQVKYEQLDWAKYDALAKLPLSTVTQVIILAEGKDADSRTIMALLALRELDTRVVAEIVDTDNLEVLQGQPRLETVVSPEIVSMLLTQLSLQLMLEKIYEDLLSVGGNEIRLLPAPGPGTFEALAEAAAARGQLCIGVMKGSVVRLNPPRKETFPLAEGDRLIVISAEAG